MSDDCVRVSSKGGRENQITLSGIPANLNEKVDGMTFGQYWMTVKDGKPVFSHTHQPLPTPTEDSEMLPFWRRPTESERAAGVQEHLFDEERLEHASPSIYISSLCGYYYTPESYRENAHRLESYGFTCMRSRRGDDGRFWEVWYLPGVWAAEGRLKEEIERSPAPKGKDPEGKKLDRALAFLGRTVSFGSLNVDVQRLAMVID